MGKDRKDWKVLAPFWPTLAVLLQENLILTYSMEKDYRGPLLCSLENFITLDALFRGRRTTFSAIVSSSQNFSTYVLSRRALSVHIRKFMLVCFTAMCRIQMLASFCSLGKLLVLSQKAHIPQTEPKFGKKITLLYDASCFDFGDFCKFLAQCEWQVSIKSFSSSLTFKVKWREQNSFFMSIWIWPWMIVHKGVLR